MQKEKVCDKCKTNMATHVISKWWETPSDKHLCCKCYIEDGGTPADWHPECMKNAKLKTPNNAKVTRRR